MGKFVDGVKGLFRRRKPVTPQDAEEIADWVNEGGALHPDGPPAVIDATDDKPEGEPRP